MQCVCCGVYLYSDGREGVKLKDGFCLSYAFFCFFVFYLACMVHLEVKNKKLKNFYNQNSRSDFVWQGSTV